MAEGSQPSHSAQLRARLAQPQLVKAPGVYDGLSAMLVEQAGFDCAFVSGAGIAFSRSGRPDMGLVTATEAASTTVTGTGTWMSTVSTSVSIEEIVVEDPFIRGDTNVDSVCDITDALFLLESLFAPGAEPLQCPDSGDINDNGEVDVTDAVLLLNSLFVSPDPVLEICDGDGQPDSLAPCVYSACP